MTVMARRRRVWSKRVTATLILASCTRVPAISPEVEQPTSTDCGNVAASSAKGPELPANSLAAKASTRVWGPSIAAGSEASQPRPVRYVTVLCNMKRSHRRFGELSFRRYRLFARELVEELAEL